ncbi:MAG: ATP-binding protein [Actinobacteria bacterium]|nr:ATP-binding protein [Actinomycetota bacterium]
MSSDSTSQSLTIASELTAARQVEQYLMTSLRERSCPQDILFAVRLALEEALSNAIKHGNGLDPSKTVTVKFSVGPDKLQIAIADQGDGFNPLAVPDPTTDDHLEQPNGRGIMLMRAYMDEVAYNSRGNEVRMVKCIRPSSSKQAG